MKYKGHPNVEDLSGHLAAESPRCAVIVAAAFFDETLEALLADGTDRSFYARIKLSLEWVCLAKTNTTISMCSVKCATALPMTFV